MDFNIVNEPTEYGEIWWVRCPVGRFALYRYDDDLEVLYLSNVYVNEVNRCMGYGWLILCEAERMCREMGAKRVYLKADANRFVYGWYMRKGFVDIGVDDGGLRWMVKEL